MGSYFLYIVYLFIYIHRLVIRNSNGKSHFGRLKYTSFSYFYYSLTIYIQSLFLL